jgi:hypothetical protein
MILLCNELSDPLNKEFVIDIEETRIDFTKYGRIEVEAERG